MEKVGRQRERGRGEKEYEGGRKQCKNITNSKKKKNMICVKSGVKCIGKMKLSLE